MTIYFSVLSQAVMAEIQCFQPTRSLRKIIRFCAGNYTRTENKSARLQVISFFTILYFKLSHSARNDNLFFVL